MMSVLNTPEKKTIKLGEKEYRLSPLNLNVLADIEDEFDCSIDKIGKALTRKGMSAMRKLIHILLKREYPDMSLEKVGDLVDLNNMTAISEALAKVLAGE